MRNTFNISDVLEYIPASLHENKEWTIVFYAKDPQSDKLRRKRMKINKVKGIRERRIVAKKMIMSINRKLEQGWNPFIEAETARNYETLENALRAFERDKRDLRPDSKRTYESEVRFIRKYMQEKEMNDKYAIAFDKYDALDYMEQCWNKRQIGARRYNNILSFCRGLFNWMVEKRYIKENPFNGLKMKKEQSKIRVMDIEEADRKKIREYLIKKNRPFFGIMMFAFHSLLRPKEITYIKIGDIDLKRQVVTVKADVAKNHNTRHATIPDVMIPLIKELIEDIDASRKNWFLFSMDFRPGTIRRDPREIARYWSDLRKTLRLKKEIQFYSLRDSGIIQMLRDGRSPKEVMEAADHSSIEVTNKYVKEARKEASENIKKKSTAF
jgi:site-specific recombinase XerD